MESGNGGLGGCEGLHSRRGRGILLDKLLEKEGRVDARGGDVALMLRLLLLVLLMLRLLLLLLLLLRD